MFARIFHVCERSFVQCARNRAENEKWHEKNQLHISFRRRFLPIVNWQRFTIVFFRSLSFSEPQCWLLHLSGPLFCSSRNTNLNTICYRNYYSMWMQYSRNKRTQWEKNAGPNERVPMVKMYNVPMEQIKVVSNELLLICSTRNKMDKTKVVTNVELAWKRRLDLLGRYSTCNNGSSYLVFVCYWYIISSFQSLVHAISDTRTPYFSLLRIFRWDSRFKRRITNMDENESEIITL